MCLIKKCFTTILLTLCICYGNDSRSHDKVNNTAILMNAGATQKLTLSETVISSGSGTLNDNRYIINVNGVGIFVVGEKIPDTKSGYQIKKDSYSADGDEYPLYIVANKGMDILKIEPEYDHSNSQWGNTIREINVLSDQYHTDKGIKIGSTIEDLVEAYPSGTIFYTYVSDRFVYHIDTNSQVKIQFILERDAFIGKKNLMHSDMVKLSLSDFKSEAKVKYIRLYK